MELNNAIKKRHSVRRFTSKKPDWREIIHAIDLANKAPLAGNLSALRFILVNDPEKIQKLADASQQDFVSHVHYIVVFCTDTKQLVRNYGDRGKMYARQQAGSAVENFLLAIEELGLGTCWVGAFVDHIVKRILKIPDEIDVEAMFPIGYEMPPKTKQRRKPNFDSVMFFNEYKNKRMVPLIEPEPR